MREEFKRRCDPSPCLLFNGIMYVMMRVFTYMNCNDYHDVSYDYDMTM